MKPNRTTIKDFEHYKTDVIKWIKEFGLINWEIDFEHQSQPDCGDEVSWLIYSKSGSQRARFGLNPDWDDEQVSYKAISLCALHEVLHLLLADLCIVAEARYGVCEHDLGMAEHKVIRRLESVLINDQ